MYIVDKMHNILNSVQYVGDINIKQTSGEIQNRKMNPIPPPSLLLFFPWPFSFYGFSSIFIVSFLLIYLSVQVFLLSSYWPAAPVRDQMSSQQWLVPAVWHPGGFLLAEMALSWASLCSFGFCRIFDKPHPVRRMGVKEAKCLAKCSIHLVNIYNINYIFCKMINTSFISMLHTFNKYLMHLTFYKCHLTFSNIFHTFT